MSANEWLHFINPLIVMMLIIALITSLPVTGDWRKRFQLAETPLSLRKAVKIFAIVVGLCALCWLPALWALHITTPQVRVNVVAASQVMFGIAIITTSLVAIIRLFHRDNIMSLLLVLAKRYLPAVITVLGKLATALLVLFLDAAKDAPKRQEKLDKENEPYKDPKGFMNYNGDYCDKNKSTWYF